MKRSELPAIDWWPNPADAAVIVAAALVRLGGLSTGASERAVRAEIAAALGVGPAIADAVGARVVSAAEWFGATARSRSVRLVRSGGRVRFALDSELLAPGSEIRARAERRILRAYAVLSTQTGSRR